MRTVALAVLAALAIGLVLVVQSPERRTGQAAVSGPRLVRIPSHAVRELHVRLDAERLAARRDVDGWRVDDRPAPPPLAEALDDLVEGLVTLRAVDAFRFRGADETTLGFARPLGVVEVGTVRGRRRLVLGALTTKGTAVYARRDRDPRTFLLGTYLLSQLGRVFHQRAAAFRNGTPGPAAEPAAGVH